MPGDEQLKNQERATKQADQREKRYEARCQIRSATTITNPDLSTATVPPPDLKIPTSNFDCSNTNLTVEYCDPSSLMEQYQYKAVINSIPTFSGETREKVDDWLEIISLKFDILAYEPQQRRRFIPQYLAGNALKWHFAHREDLNQWHDYTTALRTAFPQVITTSRDMNLQMLRNRKQKDSESFTEYYASILELCRQHDSDMADPQLIDWLKAGMKLTLYERLQGEDFPTPQSLLTRAQRLELDNAVFEARKREHPRSSITSSNSTAPAPTYARQRDYPTYHQSSPTPTSTLLYPTSLMSTPTPYTTSNYTPTPPLPYSSASSPRRLITCYTCGQPGHISPHCPTHPKY